MPAVILRCPLFRRSHHLASGLRAGGARVLPRIPHQSDSEFETPSKRYSSASVKHTFLVMSAKLGHLSCPMRRLARVRSGASSSQQSSLGKSISWKLRKPYLIDFPGRSTDLGHACFAPPGRPGHRCSAGRRLCAGMHAVRCAHPPAAPRPDAH